jgi:hypothetical protein
MPGASPYPHRLGRASLLLLTSLNRQPRIANPTPTQTGLKYGIWRRALLKLRQRRAHPRDGVAREMAIMRALAAGEVARDAAA